MKRGEGPRAKGFQGEEIRIKIFHEERYMVYLSYCNIL
jgi:hypothetical protein